MSKNLYLANETQQNRQEMLPEVPRPRPATRSEKSEVQRYRAIRRRIHEGPFFTLIGDDVRVGKSHQSRRARFDPFEGMPTYTQKYKPQVRTLPKFNTRVYGMFVTITIFRACLMDVALKLFPEELLDVIDPSSAPKTKQLAKKTPSETQQQALDDEEEKDDADEVPNPDEDEVEEGSDNPEEDFSDNDSEMAGDYNAEAYFDNGDDEVEDTGGDAGGGDADFD